MAEFEINLGGGAPWGFRLNGGKEFRAPLRVAKVIKDGKAQDAGIRVGDQVIEINGINVEQFYHTEALVAVKKATARLHLKLKRDLIQSSDDPQLSEDFASTTFVNPGDNMIQTKAFNPAPDVPLKPASATSVAVDKALLPDQNIGSSYGSSKESGYISYNQGTFNERSEWSPHMINEIVRTPDPISISKNVEGHFENSDSAFEENQYDDIPRSSSLPRSLGKKIKQGMEQKSMTLPRKSSQHTPAWYKEMYKEINKTMEGQSHLSRLLTADAARGAFRDYDGATSPRSLSPYDESKRKQRPKSVHVDRFNFQDFTVSSDSNFQNDAESLRSAVKQNLDVKADKKEKRHSVHSLRYRDFQKGGEIPAAGLSASSQEDKPDQSANLPVLPTHARSRSQDDMLTSNFKGLPYQRYDQKQSGQKSRDPVQFEYNNPPDFLELRRKAEAEGTLREERERELKMLQEQRRKWLQEEEELRNSGAKKQELERQRRVSDEKRKAEMELRRLEQEREEKKRDSEIDKRTKEREQQQQKNSSNQFDNHEELLCCNARALYSFQPQTPSELSFKKGDILVLKRQIDENWYEGELKGKTGIFPVSYIQVLEDMPEPEPEPEVAEDHSEIIQIEEGAARARYTFHAESENELSFKKNDVITLLRQIDENWCEGEVGDQLGIFPVAYVEILKLPRVIKTPVHLQPELEKEHHNIVPKLVKSNGIAESATKKECDASLSSMPVSHMSEKNKEPHKSIQPTSKNEISEQSRFVDSSVPQPAQPDVNRHRVLFSYNAENEDELELKEGDIVNVLEKCDDGWYVGTCERSGMFGIFPGNYVVSA